MRSEVYEQIIESDYLLIFLRRNPIWYRTLTRDPSRLAEFQTAAKIYFGKSLPDRVSKVSSGVQMASILLSMFQKNN